MTRVKQSGYFGLAWMAVTALALVAAVPQVHGDETVGEAEKVTPLGVRQQHVERMMEDLGKKFESLAAGLQKTEPERAEKILKALNESKSLGVQARMSAITRLLNDQQLDPAAGEQKKILDDVRKLLELLLDDGSADKLEEYDRLAKWKEDLENIIKDEKQQEKESDKFANKDDSLDKLAKQIAGLKKLIEQQEDVINKTGEARAKGAQALGPVADAQRGVRKETEKLAGDIDGQPAQPAAGPGKEGGAEAGKEGAGKEGAGKEGAGKEGAGKEGAGKEGAGKEGGEAGKEGAAGGEQGSEGGAEAGKEASQPQSPSAQALQKAAEHQQRAESHLQAGKGKAAETEEKQALEDLKNALKKLENEQDRIARLPPEAFEEMAGKQDDTANKTAKLGDDMKKGSQGGEGGEGGESGESGEGGEQGGQKKPGQKQVQQAQQAMQRASGDLRKKDPAEANKQQKKAIKELEKAIEEIEERLAQLREETQLEKLARLEARFAEMLARQEATTRSTAELAKKKSSGADLTRTERGQVAKLSAEELGLAEKAQQANDIIIEDGTSVVFPEVVGQLQTDFTSVAQLLAQQRADDYTVSVQQEIEHTLRELIDALQKAQQQKKESGGGGGGGGGGEPPLLPNSAELKLLRSMQIRVNSRTASLDKARPQDGPLDAVLQKEMDGVAKRQQEISDLTQQIIERAQ